MKALIADNEDSCRGFRHALVEQHPYLPVSGIAVVADASPESTVAREIRRILDGCPICKGDFRDHTYSLLAAVALNEKTDGVAPLTQLLRCMRDCRWHDVLRYRQWIGYADSIAAFAFRCDKGRVGIVSVFSSADSAAPDEPLQFTILSLKEGQKLLAVVEPGHWIPLRLTPYQAH